MEDLKVVVGYVLAILLVLGLIVGAIWIDVKREVEKERRKP